MAYVKTAKFQIGQVVRHRIFPFRGVIFDVDPEFANTEPVAGFGRLFRI